MGDAGSMMLGLALCWFTIDVTQGLGRSLPPIACVWILAVPLLDMTRVMFLRTLRRGDVFDADREHLHHMLLARGVSPHRASLLLAAASALCGAIGVGGWRLGLPDGVLTYAFLAVLAVVIASAHARERRAGVDDRQ